MRYIGSKRLLLKNIEYIIDKHVTNKVNTFCDIFSGTSVVARHFKSKYEITSNDMLYMSYVLQKATIENNEIPQFIKLKELGICDVFYYLNNESVDTLNIDDESFFIYQNYSPSINCNRMYFTCDNAKRIDFIRITIEEWFNSKLILEEEYYYLIACLIEAIPYVSNITGTYGAYLKKWDKRSLNKLDIKKIEINKNNKNNKCYNEDSNDLIYKISGDILYIDPPYNSRQYLPNYHILETVAKYDNPNIYGKTGLRPYKDQRSKYCMKNYVYESLNDLIENANFKHIIISYSTDGILSIKDLEDILKRHAIKDSYEIYDVDYRRYKSIYNQEKSNLKELIFYIEKDIEPIKLEKQNNKKRFLKSPLNYTGGKFKLLNQIMPLMPSNINTFVDLFAGGFNVGININANKIIYNDIINHIPNLLKELKVKDLEDILEYIDSIILEYNLSKENDEGFKKLRNFYNKSERYVLDLYVLICYSFNYQIRFNNNGEYNNPFGRNKSSFNPSLRKKFIEFVNIIKSKNIDFYSCDFINLNLDFLTDNDFVYCDPPYLITTGSYNDGKRGFKGWSEKEEKELLNLLDILDSRNIKFALSNVLEHKGKTNNILLEWCNKYYVYDINISYANSNYQSKNNSEVTREVLITNYLK